MLSIIIIPTKNEQDYLPTTLELIRNQRFQDYELKVADGNSDDSTREIAIDSGFHVVDGGLPSKGKFRIREDVPLDLGVRRLEKEWRFNFGSKYFQGIYSYEHIWRDGTSYFRVCFAGDVNLKE